MKLIITITLFSLTIADAAILESPRAISVTKNVPMWADSHSHDEFLIPLNDLGYYVISEKAGDKIICGRLAKIFFDLKGERLTQTATGYEITESQFQYLRLRLEQP